MILGPRFFCQRAFPLLIAMRSIEHDVADVAGVDAGGKFLRVWENRRDDFFVVRTIALVLLSKRAVVGRNPPAIIRVLARLHLVDEVAHGQRVILRGAELTGKKTLQGQKKPHQNRCGR